MCDFCYEYREQLVLERAIRNFQTTDIAYEEATTLSIPELEQREKVKKEANKHLNEYRNYFNCQKAGR